MPYPFTSVAPPGPLAVVAQTTFRTLAALAVPACALTTVAYFTSTPALFAQLSPFRVQYAVLLAAFALFCGTLRRARWAALFTGFAIFNAWAVFRPALPELITVTETSRPPLKVLLANVLTSNPDPLPLCTLIAAEKPDLIALLEINRRWQTQLSVALLADYPHASFHSREDNFGLAILSRLPLTDIRVRFFAGDEIPSIDFTLPDHPVRILLTHPLPPGSTDNTVLRDRHLSELAGWIDAARRQATVNPPLLILGDLNSTPWCPPLRHLLAHTGLRPAADGHAWFAPTWPAPIPFLGIPLDHALIDTSLACRSYRVGPDIGSDHLPLLLEFRRTAPLQR